MGAGVATAGTTVALSIVIRESLTWVRLSQDAPKTKQFESDIKAKMRGLMSILYMINTQRLPHFTAYNVASELATRD